MVLSLAWKMKFFTLVDIIRNTRTYDVIIIKVVIKYLIKIIANTLVCRNLFKKHSNKKNKNTVCWDVEKHRL